VTPGQSSAYFCSVRAAFSFFQEFLNSSPGIFVNIIRLYSYSLVISWCVFIMFVEISEGKVSMCFLSSAI
jgi:hypothetical protein